VKAAKNEKLDLVALLSVLAARVLAAAVEGAGADGAGGAGGAGGARVAAVATVADLRVAPVLVAVLALASGSAHPPALCPETASDEQMSPGVAMPAVAAREWPG